MNKKKNYMLTNEELASFFRQNALLFSSGIKPVEGMQILINDCKDENGKALLEQIRFYCKNGDHFNQALKQTGVFPDYVIHMIALGEESGTTDACMNALADFYEKEQSVNENLTGALTYPIIMIGMMLVIIIILISKVMPIFEQVFIELGSEMDGFAGQMLKVGKSLSNYTIIITAVLGVLIVLYFLLNHTNRGRKITKKVLIDFPLTKDFYECVACQRFASALSIALSSGMETYGSLDMAKMMVEHPRMEQKIDYCIEELRKGANFSEGLVNAQIFNSLYSQMVSVGFTSGNPDIVLARIADAYDNQSTKKIQNLLSVLEPTLVIILSLIVGMILLSVILPLMGIMSSIG